MELGSNLDYTGKMLDKEFPHHVLWCGDNIEILSNFSKDSIDTCITDPPYGMSMASWDSCLPNKIVWSKIFTVLKPGAFCIVFSSPRNYHRVAVDIEDAGFIIKDQIMWITTTKMASNGLKPCHEPIVVAQKPISEKTIQLNVEKWGTGKINVSDTRIPWGKEPPKGWVAGGLKRRSFGKGTHEKGGSEKYGTVNANPNGRHPSNIIGSVLPEHQEYFYDPIINDRNAYDIYYYSGRVSTKERNGNPHPTPKPESLMSYLVKLFCPPSGVVLDPFSGSGTTGVASIKENKRYIGIEINNEYFDFSKRRIYDLLKTTSIIEKLLKI